MLLSMQDQTYISFPKIWAGDNIEINWLKTMSKEGADISDVLKLKLAGVIHTVLPTCSKQWS
jgi:hypothetical protein